MKKIGKISSICLALVLCLSMGNVHAQSAGEESSLKIGDVLEFEDGEYVVYQMDEDGIHVAKDGIMMMSVCVDGKDHHYVKQSGTSVKYEKKDNDSTYCYQQEVYSRSQCTKCGGVIVSLDSKTLEKHKYSLFGKRCTNTVNGVPCTYEKK